VLPSKFPGDHYTMASDANISQGGPLSLNDIRIRQWDQKDLTLLRPGDPVGDILKSIKNERKDGYTEKAMRDQRPEDSTEEGKSKLRWIHIPGNDMGLCEVGDKQRLLCILERTEYDAKNNSK
jgi:hypothetical protein